MPWAEASGAAAVEESGHCFSTPRGLICDDGRPAIHYGHEGGTTRTAASLADRRSLLPVDSHFHILISYQLCRERHVASILARAHVASQLLLSTISLCFASALSPYQSTLTVLLCCSRHRAIPGMLLVSVVIASYSPRKPPMLNIHDSRFPRLALRHDKRRHYDADFYLCRRRQAISPMASRREATHHHARRRTTHAMSQRECCRHDSRGDDGWPRIGRSPRRAAFVND